MSTASPAADDAQLVAGVLAGDREAFAGVYVKYGDRLHDFAFSMLRNRDEAADCVADSFVLMAEKVGQLRDPSRLRPWLYSVVRNECLRTLRGRARVAHDDDWLEAMPDLGEGPEQQVERDDSEAELRDLVWGAIEGLNDRDRALLDLHLRQGLDGAELAAAMNVTPANSYVMLSRARDQVERSLGALLIARRGSDDCAELATLLTDWDGTFSPLIRKRVARHIDGCDVCETRRRRMVSPLALLAAVPLVAAPAALKDRVLDDSRLVAHYSDSPVTPPVAPAPDDDQHHRSGAWLIVAAVLLLVLGGGAVVLWASAGDDDIAAVDAPVAGTTTAPTAAPSPAAAPTSAVSSSAPTDSTSPTASATATSATTVPTLAAPGDLQVSRRDLDLGLDASSGSVRLRNVGGTALDFTATPRAGWLTVSAGGGSLAPGAARDLRISADRSGLAEGRHSGRVSVSWSGGTVVITVRLTVDRPPVIGAITATGTDCSVPVRASVTDGAGVSSVRVTWSGAVSGQKSATRSGTTWTATVQPISVGGAVIVTFTATDSAGARTSRSRTFTWNPCPG